MPPLAIFGIAAAAGGIGSILAGHAQAGAAKSAAQLSYQAQQNALAEQQREFNINQGNLAPWIQAGQGALGQLQNLAPFQAPTNVTEANDPGYQFRLQQGMQALQNSAAARGGLLSGNTGQALVNYGQNYASNEYQNVYNRALTGYQTNYGRLAQLAGFGQSAVGTAGQLGQAAAQNIGNLYLGGAAQQGGALMAAGGATASGYAGLANAISGGLSGYGQYGLLQQLLSQGRAPGATPPFLAPAGAG